MFFKDRAHAGKILADIVAKNLDQKSWPDFCVVGIAKGGVMVGLEIAKRCNIQLLPFAIGKKIFDDGVICITSQKNGYLANKNKIKPFDDFSTLRGFPTPLFEGLSKRQALLNAGKEFSPKERVIICDDGAVSGTTLSIVVRAMQLIGVKEIIIAIPVVTSRIRKMFKSYEIFFWRETKLKNPTSGIFYFSFPDISDDEVITAIQQFSS